MITATNLASGGAGTGNNATTASITPTANSLVIVSVQSFLSGGTPPVPTISGCSMTWVQIATRQSSSSSNWAITLFRGLSASPTTGALTIAFGGTNNQAQWSVDQFSKTSKAGTNGSGAIIQVASNDEAGTSTGIAVTLGALQNPNNAAYGAVVSSSILTITKGASFTELSNRRDNGQIESEWALNQTSVPWTWGSTSTSIVAMAIEIAGESGGGFFQFL